MAKIGDTASADVGEHAESLEARRGWFLVAALATAQLVSAGTLFYGFSMFVLPMEAELGWSRTALNGALGVGLLTAGLASYPVGAWIDRFGGRAPMALGSALAALLFVAWSRVESLAGFYAIWAGLGLAMATTLYDPAFAVLVRLFARSYRSKITALTLVGGFAGTIFVPVMQVLIQEFGWRSALLALAASHVLIALPIHLGVLGERGRAPRIAAKAESRGAGPLRRAMKTPTFWGLLVSFVAYYTTVSILAFHLIPLLTERRFAPAIAAATVAAIGPAQVAGRLIVMALARRSSAVHVGRLAILAIPPAILVLLAAPASVPALFGFALVYGAANGIVTITRGTAVADLLGRDGFGAVNGAISFPAIVAMAGAPLLAVAIWASAGGYGSVLWTAVGTSCVAAAGLWFAVASARTGTSGSVAGTTVAGTAP